jgi:hypothetical protein
MKQVIRRSALSAMSVAILAGAALSMPGAIAAKGTAIIRTGICSAASDWKLKVKPDDGRLELEFEVDQNRNGRTWRVKIKDDGAVAFKGNAVTKAPSGSFSVERRIADLAGKDSVVGKARDRKSGERCVARASI